MLRYLDFFHRRVFIMIITTQHSGDRIGPRNVLNSIFQVLCSRQIPNKHDSNVYFIFSTVCCLHILCHWKHRSQIVHTHANEAHVPNPLRMLTVLCCCHLSPAIDQLFVCDSRQFLHSSGHRLNSIWCTCSSYSH